MNFVKILSENVANRIAAGEVVERPASVVKELVENSLDSGATNILIKIEKGGKELIQVIDNGKGMSEDDALLALERHATSKISNVDDITHIATLGFRGEAIPSIASVSRFTLVTKDDDSDVATDIYVESGKLKDVRKTAANTGTNITVRKIFYNVPARRKFLKSDNVEFKHIQNYIHYQSILYPNVSFRFISNGRERFNYPAVNSYKKRILEIYGSSFKELNLVDMEYNNEGLHIFGFITGLKEHPESILNFKYLFINGRYIYDKIVVNAIKTAYQPFMAKERLIQSGGIPSYIIFLEMNPELVDVNVHPAKREVRFRNNKLIHDSVKDAITNVLNNVQKERFIALENRFGSGFAKTALDFEADTTSDNITHDTFIQKDDRNSNLTEENVDSKIHSLDVKFDSQINDKQPKQNDFLKNQNINNQKETKPRFHEYKKEFSNLVQCTIFDEQKKDENKDEAFIPEVEPSLNFPVKSEVEALNPWQFQNTFIFVEVGSDLMIIDQHAAHERILYEKLIYRIQKDEPETQKLIFPIVIDLPHYLSENIKELIESNIEDFNRIGFSIKPFSGNSLVIEEIPVELSNWSGEKIFLEVLQQIEKEFEETEDFRDSIAKSVSCKAAIKAGFNLTQKEMIKLIGDLFGCKVPYYCPHGRPLIINMSLNEFKKRFKRII